MAAAISFAFAMAPWIPPSVGVRITSAPSTLMTAVLGPTNFSGTTTITR